MGCHTYYVPPDLSILAMVHKSSGAKMDCSDTIYSTNICIRVLAKSTILQREPLLCIFQRSSRLLRSFCNLQLLVVMLRIPRRRRQHHVRNPWEANKVKL